MVFRTFRGISPGDANGRDGLLNPERGFRFEIGVGRTPENVTAMLLPDSYEFYWDITPTEFLVKMKGYYDKFGFPHSANVFVPSSGSAVIF